MSRLRGSEGKSGSFFFFTHDNKYMLKTIHEAEFVTLNYNYMKDYYLHCQDEEKTLLCRIYGLYTLKVYSYNMRLILMENLCPIDEELILQKFDLKGSMIGRHTKRIDLMRNTKTFKDKDFIELERHLNIDLKRNQAREFMELLKKDIQFLSKCNLMDYSFLLIIAKYSDPEGVNEGPEREDLDFDSNRFSIDYGKYNLDRLFLSSKANTSKDRRFIYFVGLIDYLTQYTSTKKLENTFKTILNYKDRDAISSVNPLKYARRMFEFLNENFFEKNL